MILDRVKQGVYKRIVGAMSGLKNIDVRLHPSSVPAYDPVKNIIEMPNKISFAENDKEEFDLGRGILVHESGHVLFLPTLKDMKKKAEEFAETEATTAVQDFHEWHNIFADVNNEWKTGELFPHLRAPLKEKSMVLIKKKPEALTNDNPMMQVLLRTDTFIKDDIDVKFPDKYDPTLKKFVEDTVEKFQQQKGHSMSASELMEFTKQVTLDWQKVRKDFKDNPFSTMGSPCTGGSGGKSSSDITKEMGKAIEDGDDAKYEKLKEELEKMKSEKREWYKDDDTIRAFVKPEAGGSGEFGNVDIEELRKKLEKIGIPTESISWGDSEIIGDVNVVEMKPDECDSAEKYDDNEAQKHGKRINAVLRRKIFQQDEFESRQRSGTIDMEQIRQQIAKTGMLATSAVFQRDIDYKRLGGEIAVSVLMDCSGSMRGSKMKQAKQTLATLSYAFEGIHNIHYELVGFTHDEDEKNGNVYEIFLKRYKERKAPIVRLEEVGSHTGNADGINIRASVKRIMRMYRHLKKIIIVISDGQPAYHKDGIDGEKDTADTVKRAESLGIKMVGIGIDNPEIRNLYPNNHYSLEAKHDLANELVKCILKALNGAAKEVLIT